MIQFYCSSCGRPIEVDDPFAGQQATCPYCNQVTAVPRQSTYRPGIGGARPAAFPPAGTIGPAAGRAGEAEPPAPPAGGLHVGGGPAPRERLARRLSRWALLCTVVAVALAVAVMGAALIVFFERVDMAASAPLTREQQLQMQSELEKEVVRRFPWVPWAQLGSLSVCVVGLSLSITSVVSWPRRNVAGVMSLVVCGLMMLCFCASVLTIGRLAVLAGRMCVWMPPALVDMPPAGGIIWPWGKVQ